jgi:hypothetical protein
MTREEVASLLDDIPQGLTADDFLVALASRAAAVEREKVACWMMRNMFATGGGDSTEDLLAELEWQIAETRQNSTRH